MPRPDVDVEFTNRLPYELSAASQANADWQLRVSDHVLWCAHEDVVTLLDLGSGRYATLQGSGATIWLRICDGFSLEEIANHVAASHSIPVSAGVVSDVKELVAEFEKSRILTRVPRGELASPRNVAPEVRSVAASCAASAPALPSISACLWRLALVHLQLRFQGLRAAVRSAGRTRRRLACDPPKEWFDELADRVSAAVMLAPFQAACLEESLTVLSLIFERGAQARLRIGVEVYPFMAHAWVEHAGSALGQSDDSLERFRPFPPIHPWTT